MKKKEEEEEILSQVEHEGLKFMRIPQELLENMRDPLWRIQNLYKIKDKNGNVILFKLNKYQLGIYYELHTRNVIPKARQLGVTTLMTIVYLDQILFSSHKKAVIIAKDDTSLKEIFREKILFALDNLPSWAKTMFSETESQTQRQVIFANGSSMAVQTSARSGTVNYLHVSELGPIDFSAPWKADEVVSGSLNTTNTEYQSGNMITIESTSKGPKGHFYRISMKAEELRLSMIENPRIRMSPNDYKIHFLTWWMADEYEDHTNKEITEETRQYFRGLSSALDMPFSESKMRWWQFKKGEQGEDMEYEYPSTLEEAFTVKKVGIIYGEALRQLFEDKRYRPVVYNPSYYVDTWWDLGVSDSCVIIFTQTIKGIIYVIDVYDAKGKGLKEHSDMVQRKPYRYWSHNLPWDGAKRDMNAKTPKRWLVEYGLMNVRVSERLSFKIGIDNTESLFPRFVINELKCGRLKNALMIYRWKVDSTTGESSGTHVHDEASHFADALRTLGTSYRDYNSSVRMSDDEDGYSEEDIYQNVYEE